MSDGSGARAVPPFDTTLPWTEVSFMYMAAYNSRPRGADVAEGAAPNSAELSRGQTDGNVDWQRPLPS
jgi:hypothetical protein